MGFVEKEAYFNGVTTLTAATPTIGSRQYPKTDTTRYASMPVSDIRLRRV